MSLSFYYEFTAPASKPASELEAFLRAVEGEAESGVLGTFQQAMAHPGISRHCELESICRKVLTGSIVSAQTGTGRHAIFLPGLPLGLPLGRQWFSENVKSPVPQGRATPDR